MCQYHYCRIFAISRQKQILVFPDILRSYDMVSYRKLNNSGAAKLGAYKCKARVEIYEGIQNIFLEYDDTKYLV